MRLCEEHGQPGIEGKETENVRFAEERPRTAVGQMVVGNQQQGTQQGH